jgi:hypothetical protein
MAQQAACSLFHCSAGSETSNSFGQVGGLHYFTQVAHLLSNLGFIRIDKVNGLGWSRLKQTAPPVLMIQLPEMS